MQPKIPRKIPLLVRAKTEQDYREWARLQNWAWGILGLSVLGGYGLSRVGRHFEHKKESDENHSSHH